MPKRATKPVQQDPGELGLPAWAKAIAQARKALGLSQGALAEAVGRSQSTVGEWETGKSRPRPDIWPKLKTILQIDYNEIILIDEPEQYLHSTALSTNQTIDDNERTFVYLYRRLRNLLIELDLEYSSERLAYLAHVLFARAMFVADATPLRRRIDRELIEQAVRWRGDRESRAEG